MKTNILADFQICISIPLTLGKFERSTLIHSEDIDLTKEIRIVIFLRFLVWFGPQLKI